MKRASLTFVGRRIRKREPFAAISCEWSSISLLPLLRLLSALLNPTHRCDIVEVNLERSAIAVGDVLLWKGVEFCFENWLI